MLRQLEGEGLVASWDLRGAGTGEIVWGLGVVEAKRTKCENSWGSETGDRTATRLSS